MTNVRKYISLSICQIDPLKIPPGVLHEHHQKDGSPLAPYYVVTWLPPDMMSRVGLPRGSICGVLPDSNEPLAVEHLIETDEFLELVHSICAHDTDPELVSFAGKTAESAVALIDQRSPNVDAAIPTEDIIGTYAIEHGNVGKYSPNPNYRLVTSKGCFQLTPWLRKCLAMKVIPREPLPFGS
jgi:hypothetical protein